MYRNTIITSILLLFLLELVSICNAVGGEVIVFERPNVLLKVDVGHVGVAFQNDGSWTGGAIENPLGRARVEKGGFNGGWSSHFASKADVIKEFTTDRSSPSGDIEAHAAYTNWKVISVEDADPNLALEVIKGFHDRGYLFPTNTCLTGVNDVLEKYGVKNRSFTLEPKDYFNDLPGVEYTSNAAVAGASNIGTQSIAQDSESSVVGEWEFYWSDGTIDQIDLRHDGTFTQTFKPVENTNCLPSCVTGTWSQVGNTISLRYETWSVPLDWDIKRDIIDWTASGIINRDIKGDTMSGSGVMHTQFYVMDAYSQEWIGPSDQFESYDWSATRV